MSKDDEDNHLIDLDFMRSCPSPNKLFPETVRRPLRDLVSATCPRVSNTNRLRAAEFQASNADHLRALFDMGVTMVSLGNGKVQLLHSFYNVSRLCIPRASVDLIYFLYQAKSAEEAERGLLFMQEMIELSKTTSIPSSELHVSG